jgi:hypothetical protein
MKRLRIVILVTVLVAGCVTLHLFHAREPRYQDRTLSQWLQVYERATDSQPEKETAVRAIKQIGSNAFPFLLKELACDDTPLEFRVKFWLRRHSLISVDFIEPQEHWRRGLECFQILKADAMGAVPGLVKLTKGDDGMARYNAWLALTRIDPKREVMLPVLLQLIHDPHTGIHLAAVEDLIFRYPEEAEKAGVGKEFEWRNVAGTNDSLLRE